MLQNRTSLRNYLGFKSISRDLVRELLLSHMPNRVNIWQISGRDNARLIIITISQLKWMAWKNELTPIMSWYDFQRDTPITTPTVFCARRVLPLHYDDVIMTTMASQITSLTVVYSIVYSGANQRKHQSSTSLAFVWGIQRDRWIPRTKGQERGKCFRLMTSSCNFLVIDLGAIW